MSWYAKFASKCVRCDRTIYPGDEVEWEDVDDRTVRHESCDDFLDLTPRPVCGSCFMQVAVSGACGC